MALTTYAEDFQAVIDRYAPSFEYIMENIAGDYADDYDIDAATRSYVDAIDEITHDYGIIVTISGIAYIDLDADDLSDEQYREMIDRIDDLDANGILQEHYIGEPRVE